MNQRVNSLGNVGVITLFMLVLIGCNGIRTTLTGPTDTVRHKIPTPRSDSEDVVRLQAGETLMFVSRAHPSTRDSWLDLDTGTNFQEPSKMDLTFSVTQGSTSTDYSLQPVNGAMAYHVGKESPGFDGCQGLINRFSPKGVLVLIPGDYICILTNEARLAQVQIDKLNHLGAGSIRLRFVTWEGDFSTSLQELSTAHPVTVTPLASPTSPSQPTGTADTSIAVLRQGQAQLISETADAHLNLDGDLSDISESDLEFVLSRGGGGSYFAFLVSLNGARFQEMGSVEPGFGDCRAEDMDLDEGSTGNLRVGDHYCVVTSESNLARVRIEEIELSESQITVSFIVWQN